MTQNDSVLRNREPRLAPVRVGIGEDGVAEVPLALIEGIQAAVEEAVGHPTQYERGE